MKLLVTCCNKIENESLIHPGKFVYLIDIENQTCEPVDLGLNRSDHGVSGACSIDDGWIFVVQNDIRRAVRRDPVRLVRLDRARKPLAVYELQSVEDPHSICMIDSDCYVVSTGFDEIVKLENWVHQKTVKKFSVERENRLHVNSVIAVEGELYFTAFGEKTGLLKKTAKQGYIKSLSSGSVIMAGLYHPHSLLFHKGKFWICESGAGKVYCDGKAVVEINKGYVRGLHVTDDVFVVGVSRQRKKSKSLSKEVFVTNPEKIGCCELRVYCLDKGGEWYFHKSISMEGYADEIYDLVLAD